VLLEFVFITSENKIQPYPFINPFQTKGRFFMKSQSYSHQDLVRIAKFAPDDFARIGECRHLNGYSMCVALLFAKFGLKRRRQSELKIVG